MLFQTLEASFRVDDQIFKIPCHSLRPALMIVTDDEMLIFYLVSIICRCTQCLLNNCLLNGPREIQQRLIDYSFLLWCQCINIIMKLYLHAKINLCVYLHKHHIRNEVESKIEFIKYSVGVWSFINEIMPVQFVNFILLLLEKTIFYFKYM